MSMFGAIPSPVDERDFKYSLMKEPVALPSEYSLPEWAVNNQNPYGSCVGQAASAIKDYQETKERRVDFDSSPLYVYSHCKKNDGLKEAGTYPREAMKVLLKNGICTEKTFPHSLMTNDVKPPTPPAAADAEASAYRVASYAQVYSIQDIKQAIYQDGPVLAAFNWYQSMSSPESGFIPMPYGNYLGGHAIAITGWHDFLTRNYSQKYKGETMFTGFFRIRNSWGAAWGLGGYAWIPYKMITDTAVDVRPLMEAWTTVDIVADKAETKREIVITPGAEYAEVDGARVKLDQPAMLMQDTGRVMVPLRFVGEAFGWTVEWKNGKAYLNK